MQLESEKNDSREDIILEESEKEARIKEIISNSKNGITINEIARLAKLSRVTVEKYIQKLLLKNEIYFMEFGPVKVFYPNHRPHYKVSHDVPIGANRVIYMDLMENNFGTFVRLVERRKFEGKKWQTMGTIIFPEEKIDLLIEGLSIFKEKIKQQKERFSQATENN